MTHATYADLFMPSTKFRALLYDAALILGGSFLLTLSAKTSFILPFSPVPITLQTLVVLLIGALLGRNRGSITVLAYLCEGTMGFPVFAKAGAGFAYLMGPTGGYLVGFVFAAYITGYLAEKGWDRKFGRTALAMTLGNITLLSFGVSWLSLFVGFNSAILVGFVPFVVGDVLKIAIAAAALPTGWKLLNRS